MKRTWKRRAAALVMSLAVLATSASALTVEQARELLEEHYYGEIPAQALEQDTVEGLLAALNDPYTRYMTEEEYQQFLASLDGTEQDVPQTVFVLYDDHIGYLTCGSFGGQTYAIAAEAVAQSDGADRWIVDLREGGGGLLQAGADTLGIFTGSGTAALLRDRDGRYQTVAPVEEGPLTLYPVVVLVGADTQGAGELFAAAVQDRRSGLVLGQRTDGRGLAQVILSREEYPDYFEDGSVLTVSSVQAYSAQGAAIEQVGMIPDLVVDPALIQDAAMLLRAAYPAGGSGSCLRLHLGGWRWYVDLGQAVSEEYQPAFTELLEALPPETDLFLEGEDGQWSPIDPAALAADYAPGYTPRTFGDAAGSPYETAINTLAVYGLVEGSGQGAYDPEGSLTRAQLCAMLARALDLRQDEGAGIFADVPADAWYAGAVEAMYREGLASGVGDGLFRPDAAVSNEEFTVMMARTAAWLSAGCADVLAEGPDGEALADPALAGYHDWSVREAWLMGRSLQDYDGAFVSMLHDDLEQVDPQAATTRGEAAESLYRVLCCTGVLAG